MKIFLRLDLLMCSFLINILVLAIPLYVIHALTRFLANGSYPTLYFLTLSVIFAITLELFLRYLRKLLLLQDNKKKINNNKINIKDFLDDVSKIKIDLLVFNSILDHFKNFKNNNIEKQINLLDLPYVFLFSVVIYFLSPTIFLVFLLTAIIISILSFEFKCRCVFNLDSLAVRAGKGGILAQKIPYFYFHLSFELTPVIINLTFQ